MAEITFNYDDIEKHCGAGRVSGPHVYFQCPFCQDKGKDNMIFTPSKHLLKCFASDEHAPDLLKIIYTEKHAAARAAVQVNSEVKQWELNKKEYVEAMAVCNLELLEDPKALEYLYEKRLITKETVDHVCMGFDYDENKWVLPVFPLAPSEAGVCYGFEYRPADFGVFDFNGAKCIKEKDTPSCLALAYGGYGPAKNLYIVEGFLDGYVLAQWMEYPRDTVIVTPTMGVGTLPEVITEINFNDYENIYLCLDNDPPKKNKQGVWVAAGPDMTKKIREIYPFIIDKSSKVEGIKDITDMYREWLKDE